MEIICFCPARRTGQWVLSVDRWPKTWMDENWSLSLIGLFFSFPSDIHGCTIASVYSLFNVISTWGLLSWSRSLTYRLYGHGINNFGVLVITCETKRWPYQNEESVIMSPGSQLARTLFCLWKVLRVNRLFSFPSLAKRCWGLPIPSSGGSYRELCLLCPRLVSHRNLFPKHLMVVQTWSSSLPSVGKSLTMVFSETGTKEAVTWHCTLLCLNLKRVASASLILRSVSYKNFTLQPGLSPALSARASWPGREGTLIEFKLSQSPYSCWASASIFFFFVRHGDLLSGEKLRREFPVIGNSRSDCYIF